VIKIKKLLAHKVSKIMLKSGPVGCVLFLQKNGFSTEDAISVTHHNFIDERKKYFQKTIDTINDWENWFGSRV